MATIPDVELSATEYTELYAASGIQASSSVMIQNKTNGHVYIQYNDSKPASGSHDGFIILEMGVWTVPAGNQKIWARGKGFIAVDVLSA